MKKIIFIFVLFSVWVKLYSASFEFGIGEAFSKSDLSEENFKASFIIETTYRLQYPFFIRNELLFASTFKEVKFGIGYRYLPEEFTLKGNLFFYLGSSLINYSEEFFPLIEIGNDFRILFDYVFVSLGFSYKSLDKKAFYKENEQFVIKLLIGGYL